MPVTQRDNDSMPGLAVADPGDLERAHYPMRYPESSLSGRTL